MDYQIGIVGAGFAGLAAALRLSKSGRNSFVIFEKASQIGGTWRDNIYPGCACDVPSPLYCFADEPNYNWSRLYSGQAEILDYLKNVVKRNDLVKHIRYNTEIVEAAFQKKTGRWKLTDVQGKVTGVRMLILATGPLNRPHIPNFPGIRQFSGTQFHTSEWDRSCDLRGKKIAIIGTGASAVQVIPSIASLAKEFFIFQRTPAWITPLGDKAISPLSRKLWNRVPALLRMKREAIYWLNEFVGLGFVGNSLVNGIMRAFALRTLRSQVRDPDLRNRLTPDYKIGCKRILSSDNYYPVFNQPHVRLVTGCIEKIVPTGIVTEGNTFEADVIIYATGFNAADINLNTKITGPDGRDLVRDWFSNGAEAYLGTTVSGFPNLAFVLGPNTGLGNNSVLHMMESQMNYVIRYLELLDAGKNNSYLDLKANVQRDYNIRLQSKFAGTVWSSGCKSWYINKAGKNTTLFPGLSVQFRKLTRRFEASDYKVLTPVVETAKVMD